MSRNSSSFRETRGFSLIEMMMVCAVMGVIAAIAIPMSGNTLRYLKLNGDARDMSNAAALAKMRAAAKFTQSRLYLDLSASTFYIQTYDKTTSSWVNEAGASYLSSGVSYGYGPVSAAPPNTQTTIGQPPQCMNTATPPAAIANSACIIFNSRGLPVDTTGSPTGDGAVYLTDNSAVYGVTAAATGFIRLWRTPYQTTASWSQQ